MTPNHESPGDVDVEVTIDGKLVWSGSAPSGISPETERDNFDGIVEIRIGLGPEVTSLARERLAERKAEGPEYEGSVEDVLWEFVDVKLTSIE